MDKRAGAIIIGLTALASWASLVQNPFEIRQVNLCTKDGAKTGLGGHLEIHSINGLERGDLGIYMLWRSDEAIPRILVTTGPLIAP